jgi:hypothetical protein
LGPCVKVNDMSSPSPRPSLECPCCGKWFALFHARPDLSSIAEPPLTFQAKCRECGDVAAYSKAAITIRYTSQPTGRRDPVILQNAPGATRCEPIPAG